MSHQHKKHSSNTIKKTVKKHNPFRGAAGLEALTTVAAALGAAAAKPNKHKKTKKPIHLVGKQSMALVTPNVSYGFVTNVHHNHTPFRMSGCALAAYLSVSAAGTSLLINSANSVSTTNKCTIDAAGVGAVPYDFAFFPAVVTNVSFSFLRYRIHKLHIRYVPMVATTSSGLVTFCTISDVSVAGTNMGIAAISNSENSVCTSVWNPSALDGMAKPGRSDGLLRSWCYMDDTTTSDQPNVRLESPGSFAAFYTGSVVSATVGAFYIDYDLEFDGVCTTNAVADKRFAKMLERKLTEESEPVVVASEDSTTTTAGARAPEPGVSGLPSGISSTSSSCSTAGGLAMMLNLMKTAKTQ